MRMFIVMNMKKIVTVTSKGQLTLPASFRKHLNIGASGGVLQVEFNEQKNEVVIKKPLSIADLSQHVSRHIKDGTEPLNNVEEYYQEQRGKA